MTTDLLRRWLHTRNHLRQHAPDAQYKHWQDLDALGPLWRDGNKAERMRITQIERRYTARLNRKGRD
jgi:hypothetical protein